MALSSEEALPRLMSKHGAERAKCFEEMIPQIEDDDLLLELVMLVPWDAKLANSLTLTLMSLIQQKRKMMSDIAALSPAKKLFEKEWPWMFEREIPLISDVMLRDSFRDALVAVCRLTILEYEEMAQA